MPRRIGLLVLAVLVSSSSAAAQNSAPVRPEAAAEIRGRLRSFYFNLTHQNWEALTADILAAKVVAHRSPPDGLSATTVLEAACPGPESVSIDAAFITLVGDWAGATVPHCAPAVGRDEFRLIRFDGRWRFVAIRLFRQPATVTVGR